MLLKSSSIISSLRSFEKKGLLKVTRDYEMQRGMEFYLRSSVAPSDLILLYLAQAIFRAISFLVSSLVSPSTTTTRP